LTQLHNDGNAMQVDHAEVDAEKVPLLRCSVIIGMVMLLKAHLKTVYGLSEEYASICSVIMLVD
jgi:hypothetical protein